MDDIVREMVTKSVGESEFRQGLEQEGFVDINHEGIKLVNQGVVCLPEFIRTMYDAR
jgi:type II secretory ATPase GspE/PulE/Tfp pilus assembly ATPase PilB-like protein